MAQYGKKTAIDIEHYLVYLRKQTFFWQPYWGSLLFFHICCCASSRVGCVCSPKVSNVGARAWVGGKGRVFSVVGIPKNHPKSPPHRERQKEGGNHNTDADYCTWRTRFLFCDTRPVPSPVPRPPPPLPNAPPTRIVKPLGTWSGASGLGSESNDGRVVSDLH